ncbi:MAG: Re/Si-specific NAD(P)(+) transhydrogenase subunit alpha [Eggerthellaceae bacterium]|nr:Re/Si-specific NAD(P)(+) transhydrogenase subunit alpha [Eggerthellaceae bacterium]
MLIGIPKEAPGQKLVAATPDTTAKLIKLGYDVCVETGAGIEAAYRDADYEAAGAKIVDTQEVFASDIVCCLDTPSAEKLALIKQGATLICRMNPWGNADDIETFKGMGITALAMDAVPRLTRAQSLDVRSSMMNVSGYRAVIEAANEFGRTFAGQVTAAGKTQPAKVYVIGVGVAGLSALGTAGSMGAQIFATDVRPEVADQVESLGGTFVEIPVKQESKDGYAKALDEEQQKLTLAVYTEQCAKNDIIITTAAVPGRPAPLLITEEAVAGMKPGSVIVDMGASPLGGNCALSKPGEVVVTDNGVTIIGYMDLPSRMPGQSSQLYGQNIVNFFKLTTPSKDGQLVLDEDDAVVRGVTVTLAGEGMWPPPAVQVSAAPKQEEAAPVAAEAEPEEKSGFAKHWWKVLAAILLVLLVLFAPESMQTHFTVFALACVVGFYVITAVTHSLHTPLMSETNAISGIIVVGAVFQVVTGLVTGNMAIVVLSAIAVAIASINIFGGFLVTRRMLKMFERSSE